VSAPSAGTRGDQLRSLAIRLQADVAPYYLHRPRKHSEPAPGWYWQPAGAGHPHYLAANSWDAYAKLRRLLDEQSAG
jgi:hypothetical protein